MEKPPELFDREAEWSDLVAFTQQRGAGIRLALVRGRRRQGKSFLLRRIAEATGGFYLQALEQERSQALDGLGRALGEYLAVPGGRLAFNGWDDALAALVQLRRGNQPAVAVIDEFPYLLAHSPELPSRLQRQSMLPETAGPPCAWSCAAPRSR